MITGFKQRTPLYLRRDIEVPRDSVLYIVDRPFVVSAFRDGNEIPITVEAGFDTDLASVPSLFWWMFSPAEYPEAATVHDWLYVQGSPDFPKEDADKLFYLMLEGMDSVKRDMAYRAVSEFGTGHWPQPPEPEGGALQYEDEE